jgi:hypothetical protein
MVVLGAKTTNLSCGLNPIHTGHLEIQDHHIGVKFFDFLNRYFAVLGFTAHSPSGVWLDIGSN